MPFGTPHHWSSVCREGKGCTPRRSVSPCREGRGCSLHSRVSPSRGGRGCSLRTCLSACRGGRGCSLCRSFSPSREGKGCSPHTCFSAFREDTGYTPCTGVSPFHASTVSLPFVARHDTPRAQACAHIETTWQVSWLFLSLLPVKRAICLKATLSVTSVVPNSDSESVAPLGVARLHRHWSTCDAR